MSLWIFLNFIGLLRNLVTSRKSPDYKANLIGSHSNLVPEDLISNAFQLLLVQSRTKILKISSTFLNADAFTMIASHFSIGTFA